ncbi:MAG: glycosyltransferase [Pseudomonadota bacterium]
MQPQVARRMYASIILPTYTERENVGQMVEALRRVFGDRQDWEVVIVVDDSPDDT